MSTSGCKIIERKGKGKCLPKLKTILANPKKDRCPALPEDELQQLGTLLKDAINNSGLTPQSFVSTTRVHIGLESSLRAINNSKCSCVLLSHTIQPIFLIRLIARNAEAKNETVPVYVQTQLEEFTKEVFGIQALALVLPTVEEMRMAKLNDKLIQWVVTRTKPAKRKLERIIPKVVKRKKSLDIKEYTEIKNKPTTSECQKVPVCESEPKQWEGDFIALSDAMVVDKANSEEDKQHLTVVLSKVMEKVENLAEIMEGNEKHAAICDGVVRIEKVRVTQQKEKKTVEIISSDSDDFLPEIYQPLTVHKIQPNPHKKPKKKRPKKNKQNKK